MPWYKSPLRSKLNMRYARWKTLQGVSLAAPALTRRFAFYGRGVGFEEAAERRLITAPLTMDAPFSAEQERFIETLCTRNDGGVGRYWAAPVRFLDEHFLIREPVLMGHTGRLVSGDGRGVLTEWGAPANWNADKPAVLRDAEPLDAVAAPIRRFSSYFHFLFEFALPFVDLMERGRAEGALQGLEIRLVLAEKSKPFAERTVAALAKRYGLGVTRIGPGERMRCAQAWAVRRARPCPDWYPAHRLSAEAIRALLINHLGAPTPPGGGAWGERLYLRRGVEKLRNLRNAEALEALLAQEGFETLQPAAANFAEQVTRTQAARRIVVVHGAALGNLIFAEPGTEVFELFGQGGCKSLYMTICAMLGLRHRAIIGGPGDKYQNFEADLDGLRAALAAS